MRNAIFTALMSPIHISTQFRQKQMRCRMHPKDIKNILAPQPFQTVSTHMHMVWVCLHFKFKKVFSV